MEAPRTTRNKARRFRQALTLPERMLWTQIKGRRLEGLHFRRQHPLGPFVLDFYCDSAGLCVEVDGATHHAGWAPIRDAKRDAWLTSQGIRTLRLRAALILEDRDAALRMILDAASSSPAGGGGPEGRRGP
ncbi:MAG TPA: endonuclease domain-containing protein, partial [Phenylobacterium sp.]|nr:endonuclease domain-containing protein [Phenylobacterium sp.]